MRELHKLADRQAAVRLTSWLMVKGVSCQADQEDNGWTVWIHRDEQREAAQGLLAEFLANPDSAEISRAIAGREAELKTLARSTSEDQTARRRRQSEQAWRQRFDFVWYRSYPITAFLVIASLVTVVLCTDLPGTFQKNGLFAPLCTNANSPVLEAFWIQPRQGGDNAESKLISLTDDIVIEVPSRNLDRPDLRWLLGSGQWWRLVTPIFLHFGVLHIFFNMSWLWNLGRQIEFIRGSVRYGAMVLVIAVSSNIAQLLWTGPGFGGMSGVVYGLIGYAWLKGRTAPQHGIGLAYEQIVYSVFFMVLCMMGVLGPIANAAHFVGFVVGAGFGLRGAALRWLRRRLS